MEKETMMSDKDLSWFLGVEDETENEATSQEATAVPERERPTNKQDTENTMHSEPARNAWYSLCSACLLVFLFQESQSLLVK